MKKNFPRIHTLEVANPMKFPEAERDDEQHRTISYMNEDLISDISLQLPSITKFCFLLGSQYDDYRIFRRFLHLLPNLIYLQMYIGRTFFS